MTRRTTRTRGRAGGDAPVLLQRTLVVERATAMNLKLLMFWDAVSMSHLLERALAEHGFKADKGLVTFPPTVAPLRFGGRATVVTAIDVKKGLAVGQVVAVRDLERQLKAQDDPRLQEQLVDRILSEAHAELEHEAVGILMREVSAILSPRPGSPLEMAFRAANRAALATLAENRTTKKPETPKAARAAVVEKALAAPFPIYRGAADKKSYTRED